MNDISVTVTASGFSDCAALVKALQDAGFQVGEPESEPVIVFPKREVRPGRPVKRGRVLESEPIVYGDDDEESYVKDTTQSESSEGDTATERGRQEDGERAEGPGAEGETGSVERPRITLAGAREIVRAGVKACNESGKYSVIGWRAEDVELAIQESTFRQDKALLDELHGYILEMCEYLGLKRDEVPCDAWALRDALVKLKAERNELSVDLDSWRRTSEVLGEAFNEQCAKTNAWQPVVREAYRLIANDDTASDFHAALQLEPPEHRP